KNPLSDVLHWQRPDFGVPVTEVLREIAAVGEGVLVVLSDPAGPESLLARLRQHPEPEAERGRVAEWRRNGAGAQILADLGLRRLRVIGAPRRQIGLAGYGLEVVEFVEVGTG
ncbi:MAG: GTP cyclohydrolase II, partial [Rehaibacterium terrae]|uniref:GTP cyclohydrolase II n=1 Tax=Rehaibacterium terrae TaxID=1341696 RepID=UPI00391C700C